MSFFARVKAPGNQVGYLIDYSDDIASPTQIATSVWIVQNGSEGTGSSFDATARTVTGVITGGNPMKPIIARNIITTDGGERFERTITIPVDPV